MNTSTDKVILENLMARLKQETSSEHDRMEVLMQQAGVFESKENYAQFTLSQYYFQKDVEHLYLDPKVQQLIPDLDVRGRSEAALQDLKDLNVEPQQQLIATEMIKFPESLGWIYVSEGSTLGAAFLFKEAQAKFGFNVEFAARNLAAYPEGRAVVWKRFKQTLDEANFTEQEKNEVIKGALNGFNRFGTLLEDLKNLK
ncbi:MULTISPECIES: biliverdin-producing heme oxygenase [Acinetobacter]|uniref:Biliverdin-producing heme oxygenase n=1 Tax=Acinetobacter chengduensis TaxID=2420890 RepID=A0ABX9TUT6_9GAMM|nr:MULTISPECIES: biliverdin-producing heme oxygenase [Acinetobacter]MBI1453296.1 biliverdin-producing heme oxygenase [Acinetobacter sp. FL51]RKG41420.1 biliverdin-producing heme oxygenase [Acinetobacter sp. WCHAc060007]RLL20430.1 biliverdin-producing heme oxygenase [Acinetobacter chengduensis]